MCGIAGWIDPQAHPDVVRIAVQRMCDAMVHRGPDDAGLQPVSGGALGMRRLAIFDPANGRQPMRSPDGRYTLVFNGALYNFADLRRELAPAGWSFRTQCDTEVLLAAYIRWGEACLARFRGMFAFAVWDEHERSLFLARDPFGIKPLYCRASGASLLFASELNALAASGVCPTDLDPGAAADYLGWLAVPAPRTIYRGVISLQPGECATFRGGEFTLRRAWHFPAANPAAACRSEPEFTAALRGKLEDTIRAHRVADVPVGAFLSGGLDSSTVVGLMCRTGAAQLRTFAVTFPDAGYSEAAEAAEAARHFGTAHTEFELTGARLAADIAGICAAFDQPTGDGINTWYASAAARAGGVTVALSGLGGDELFGGYPSFRNIPRLTRLLPWWRSVPEGLRRRAVGWLDHGDTRRRKLAELLGAARTAHQIGALQRRVFPSTAARSLLVPAAAAGSAGPFHPALAALAAEVPADALFEIASAWEIRTYMTDVLLRDSDVMSMRHSLELRVPFVDRVLLEWLWHQPAAWKAGRGDPKASLLAAVRDLVPPGLDGRRKRGFTLPLAVWMKRELRPFLDATFADDSVDRSGLFRRAAVQQLWRDFISGNDTRKWSRVWSIAMLVQFANRRPAPPPPRSDPIRVGSPRRRAAGKVLLLAPEIFSSEGGIPRILQSYLRALAETEAEVRLVALNDASIDPADLARHGSPDTRLAVGCGRRKADFVRSALRLSRGCTDIVCGHVAQLPVAWLARRLNPRLQYHLVAHGIEVWRPFNAAERLALRGAARILCVSDYTRRELLRHCPLPPGRAVVLPNALDPGFPIGRGVPLAECAPVILTVTRLTFADRYKGIEDLIAALPAIRRELPGATLRIIGRGDDTDRLRALAAATGCGDAVAFLGFVDDAALRDEIRRCRLFALPSKKEGFGLVFLEAMASSRPCLGADAGGVPEVIDASTGILVRYGDVPGIAAAAAAALRKSWDEDAILARAEHFSFARFRERLAESLSPAPVCV